MDYFNKFQLLIESDINLIPDDKLNQLGIQINDNYVKNNLFPSLIDGARNHLEKRKKAVEQRSFDKNLVTLTVEALFDAHFRKQTHFGPTKEEVEKKVKQALLKKEPIYLVGLMFTRKNICPLKRGLGDESTVDLAEIASLIHLNNFASLVASFYPYGCRFIILSEGLRFLKAFNLCYPYVRLYQKRLKDIVKKFNLNNLEIYDFEDFLFLHLSAKEIKQREENYQKAKEIYEKKNWPIFNPNDFFKTLKKTIEVDPIKDKRNPRNNFVPLWESIKNSLFYPSVLEYAQKKGIDYSTSYRFFMKNLYQKNNDQEVEKIRQEILKISWEKAIEHNARVLGDNISKIYPEKFLSDNAFRTSINPKPGDHLGILAIKETTSRVQPWHGKAFVYEKNQDKVNTTVLTRLEIEGIKRGLPVFYDNRNEVFFYTTSKILKRLEKEMTINFDFSTR